MENNKQTYDEWLKSLENLTLKEFSEKMKLHIIKNGNLDKKSIKFFEDSFNYMEKLVELNKCFEPQLFIIYLQDVCGYKDLHFDDIIRILQLLVLCGFGLKIPEN